MMQTSMLLGIIPTVLIVLAGLLILRTGDEQAGRSRFLIFLLASSATLMLLLLVISRQFPMGQGPPLAIMVSILLTPAVLSVLALSLWHLRWLPDMPRRAQATVLILVTAVVALMALPWGNNFGLETIIAIPLIVLAWVLGRRSRWVALLLSLLALAGLIALNRFIAYPPDYTAPQPGPLRYVSFIFFALPGLVMALAAVHLTGALARLRLAPNDNTTAPHSPVRPVAAVLFSLLLLGALAYTVFWASVWDQTSDGLGGLFLSNAGTHAAIAAGMFMALSLQGRRRLGGILFAVLTPLLLLWAFNTGWDVSYHDMTERRAERITRALEQYREREESYPGSLQDLVPRHLLWVPQPLIFAGEGWCYEGSGGEYRLAAVYREHWGMSPMSVRTYAQAGDAQGPWACDERLVALKERHGVPSFQEMQASAAEQTAAQATPLPPSEVSVPRKTLVPLTLDPALMPGTWAPDGSYFVYAQPGDGGQVTLYFLERASGDVCQSTVAFEGADPRFWDLRSRHGWLADGRVLLTLGTQAVTLEPCGDATILADVFPEPIRQITAGDPENLPLLMQGETTFWLVDSTTLEARQIEDVAPFRQESRPGRAEWSPDASRLAIGHLRDEGPAISMVNPQSAAVSHVLPLEEWFGEDVPWFEWVGNDHMLARGANDLHLFDLTSEAPDPTPMFAGVLHLDLALFDEIASWSATPGADGQSFHLAVQANHPRNDDLYIYHSETGAVDVIDNDASAFLFFADGTWTETWGDVDQRAFSDEFRLLWPDDPARQSRRLIVEGHSPRSYPDIRPEYMDNPPRFLFSSSQGVSLVSLPDGDLLDFWAFPDDVLPNYAYTLASPDGSAAVVVADLLGFYFMDMADG